MNANRLLAPVAGLALLIGLALGGLVDRSVDAQDQGEDDARVQMTAVEVVEAVAPAVVTVINRQVFGGADGAGIIQPAGSGTGFVIDDEGHIVTNAHVVAGGDEFEVIFANGDELEAEAIGADPISDLAVIKVEGEMPATVALGDSDELQPGQPVLAIGSPLGSYTNTVTQGIVSALGRDLNLQPSQYTNLVQHDAAINPGNSGGPLFNLAGEVVGVNTLGIDELEDGRIAQGLFFAIPSNTVREIAEQLIDDGEVVYPFFGVSYSAVTDLTVAEEDLAVDYGVFVQRVEPDSPADEAGIEAEDVILAINGEEIDQQQSFTEILFAHEPGDTVEATIQRGDEQLTVEVTLGERPPDL
ncbi:MAG: S1C family serine protease [Thermomicrobiales bacterium]